MLSFVMLHMLMLMLMLMLGGFNPDETRWRRKDKDGNTTARPVPAELLASHGSESSYQ